MGTLHEDLQTFMIIFGWILLRTRNVSDRICTENQNTYEGGSKSFRPDIKSLAKWKMLRGINSVIYGEVNVSVCVEIKGDYIENSKVVLFVSP